MTASDLAELNADKGKANRERILEFRAHNPFASIAEIAAALGLSRVTVSRHAKAVREESK